MTGFELLALAESAGFSAALIPTKKIVVDSKFRPLCKSTDAENTMNNSCPSDCDTVEEVWKCLVAEDQTLVLQTIGDRRSNRKAG